MSCCIGFCANAITGMQHNREKTADSFLNVEVMLNYFKTELLQTFAYEIKIRNILRKATVIPYTCSMRMLLSVLCCFVISVTAIAQTYTGKVTAVKDGDTIEMLVNGKTLRVRLFGIDSPERGQPFATKAKEFTASMCFGETVKAVQQSRDQYGRIVAEVYLPDNTSLNAAVVNAGYAWHYKKFSKSPLLAACETKARKEQRGLWKDAHPVAPWEWRKRKTIKAS